MKRVKVMKDGCVKISARVREEKLVRTRYMRGEAALIKSDGSDNMWTSGPKVTTTTRNQKIMKQGRRLAVTLKWKTTTVLCKVVVVTVLA